MSLENALPFAALGLGVGLAPIPFLWLRHQLWKRRRLAEFNRMVAAFGSKVSKEPTSASVGGGKPARQNAPGGDQADDGSSSSKEVS